MKLKEKKMKTSKFQTDLAKAREKRNLAIYEEFNKLMKEPNASVGKVTEHLMKRHGIFSESTIWKIRKEALRLANNNK